MTFLVNESMVDLGVGTGALVALTGYLTVFLGLVLLMIVVMIMGKIMVASRNKKAAKAAAAAPASVAPAAAPAPQAAQAPGTAGQLMLHDVSPRDAALVMAIVANKMGKPINELRFKSIKEVK